MAGQEHGGLACGIAAADQHDVLIGAELCLDRRGPVPDALAFEGVEILDLGPPIARAAGDDDGARAQHLSAFGGERELAVAMSAIERFGRDRNQNFRAEFLRLGKGAPRQCLTGNAGGKSQIVFDAHAGAGLPAIGARVEHRDRQSLGRRIHGRRKSSGPAADHGDVIELVMGVAADHAERKRKPGLGRVLQHGAIGTDHQRHVAARGRIARNEIGGVLVDRGIEQMMRLAVARQKILQPRHVAERFGADQARARRRRPE